jgi:hypothetical protein
VITRNAARLNLLRQQRGDVGFLRMNISVMPFLPDWRWRAVAGRDQPTYKSAIAHGITGLIHRAVVNDPDGQQHTQRCANPNPSSVAESVTHP